VVVGRRVDVAAVGRVGVSSRGCRSGREGLGMCEPDRVGRVACSEGWVDGSGEW